MCIQNFDCEIPRSARNDGLSARRLIVRDAFPSFHLGIILRVCYGFRATNYAGTCYGGIDRRLIATRDRKLAQAATLWLASRNISPNAISIAGMCACIVAGIALAATSIAYYRILWIIAALGAHRSISLHSGEHRPLACSSIRPLGRIPCNANTRYGASCSRQAAANYRPAACAPQRKEIADLRKATACFPYLANGIPTVPRIVRAFAQVRAERARRSRRHCLRISIQARDRPDESRRSRPTHSMECGTESATAMN